MQPTPSLTPQALAERLLGYELLQDVPMEQLSWLAAKGRLSKLAPGERVFQQGDPIDRLIIIISGKIQFKLQQNGDYRIINELVEGDISGALPFSRAKTAMALAEAREHTLVLELSKAHFTEMVNQHTALTEALVHVMTSRVRDFTREKQQTEKMAALGRLSAGLHHELNNPASAALRAAQELKELLHLAPHKLKAMTMLRLNAQQFDQIHELVLSNMQQQSAGELSMMERSELEEKIVHWLEEHEVEDAYRLAELFARHRFDLQALHRLEEISGPEGAGALAEWIHSMLSTERLVDNIQESTRRISKLVGAVKTYSHMDRGAERERTDLAASIENTLSLLNFKLKKKKIGVQLNAPKDLPHPCVFPGELSQVWTNLIDNAIDAMDEGGKLAISLEKADDAVEIRITDNGSGIPEEIKERIFEPFFTTKSLGQGSGMGLEISQNIIRQHGGSIRVESKPGQTSFQISLPENPVT